MACRVGITSRPNRRRSEWRQKHPRLRRWKLQGPYPTKTKAQAREDALAKQLGCVAHHGGAGQERAKWYVYYFEY